MKIYGIEALHNLSKDETKVFVESFSYKSIAKTFSVSESTARRVIAKKIHEFGIVMPGIKRIPMPLKHDFSMSEDDYGTISSSNKQVITKDGLLVFNGNSPIYKVKNELTEVVKTYVCAMLNNNQPLKFTTR